MSRFRSIARFTALAGALQFVSGLASAHIHLLAPIPRYPDAVAGENKNCPCGVGTAGRTCSDPAERSDGNRSTDRETVLLGGSTLTVRVSEYIGHSGRFRVAFDPDGADVADFNQHILADIADPVGKVGNTGNGTLWEINAQLPNIDCKNCTLQVVQVMNGDTQDPVADTVGQSTYYQCADLQLTRDPSQPDGYSPPFIGPPLPLEPMDAVPDAGGGMPTGGAESTAPSPAVPARSDMAGSSSGSTGESDATSDGGCSIAARPGTPAALPSLALAAAALLCRSRRIYRSRRRRRSESSSAQR